MAWRRRLPSLLLAGTSLAALAWYMAHPTSPVQAPAPNNAPVADQAATTAPPASPAPLPAALDAPVPERQLSGAGKLTSLHLIPRRAMQGESSLLPRPAPLPVAQDAPLNMAPSQLSEFRPHTAKPSEVRALESPSAQSEASSGAKEAAPAVTYALGVGMERFPHWQGSRKSEVLKIPYIDINWQDQVEFSTVKGLSADLIHGEKWHGGVIGTLVWGRSSRDLAGLNVPTLKNTLQGGLYLEYALTPALSLGARVRHDIQNTGVAYGEVYAELELPKIGYLEHDIHIAQEAMNGTGMRRFFGLSEQDAAKLGVPSHAPRAGLNKFSVAYEGFHPTSESTGIAFGLTFGRLNGDAANSPLIKYFGTAIQREIFAAFLYHF